MPLRIPDKLPAIDALKKENIFVMDTSRAHAQDIRPLSIVILNLMPLKITTETDLIRLLSNTPLQMDVTFMKLKSHTPKNTPIEHMMMFYKDFDVLSDKKFDGMIITGAPVELLEFEDVNYWDELVRIFDWAKSHVTSTLYICWAAQAGLYYHYGIRKHALPKKMFGVFRQHVTDPTDIPRLRRLFLHATQQAYGDKARGHRGRRQAETDSRVGRERCEHSHGARRTGILHNGTSRILARHTRQGIQARHGQA